MAVGDDNGMFTGSCHCGRTRYRVDVECLDDVAVCHCSVCRRSTGGSHVTWATVPQATFHWTGEPATAYRSSEHGTRWFCPHCGAQLAFVTSRVPQDIDVTVTTLDQPERGAPDRHTWVASKLPWVHLNDGLPQESRETPRGNPDAYA